MEKLVELNARAERARLFPVLADTSKEGRLTSIFLSCLANVREFGVSLVGSLGCRVGSRGSIEAFTEISFDNVDTGTSRPDGLISVNTGKSTWRALVEAKIGNSELTNEQVERYLKIARSAGVNAVVTISNQYAPLPEHHPLDVHKNLLRSVDLYHISWMNILTQARLLIENNEIADQDHQFILGEFCRFIEHPSAGVASFDRMNSEWKELVSGVRTGNSYSKSSPIILNTVSSWHQATRNLSLSLSRAIGIEVQVKVSRAQKGDSRLRVTEDADILARTGRLLATLVVPDAAAPMEVVADVGRRSVQVSMNLAAPKDRVRATASINWLLRQLKQSDTEHLIIRTNWPGRAQQTSASLADAIKDPKILCHKGKTLLPSSFEVCAVTDDGRAFSGQKKFVELLEEIVPFFYEQAGQHLSAWVPPAPKMKEDDAELDDPGAPSE